MAKPKTPAPSSADDFKELTDRAQRQPGLAQLLSLLHEVQQSDRVVREMTDTDYLVGGTLGHT